MVSALTSAAYQPPPRGHRARGCIGYKDESELISIPAVAKYAVKYGCGTPEWHIVARRLNVAVESAASEEELEAVSNQEITKEDMEKWIEEDPYIPDCQRAEWAAIEAEEATSAKSEAETSKPATPSSGLRGGILARFKSAPEDWETDTDTSTSGSEDEAAHVAPKEKEKFFDDENMAVIWGRPSPTHVCENGKPLPEVEIAYKERQYTEAKSRGASPAEISEIMHKSVSNKDLKEFSKQEEIERIQMEHAFKRAGEPPKSSLRCSGSTKLYMTGFESEDQEYLQHYKLPSLQKGQGYGTCGCGKPEWTINARKMHAAARRGASQAEIDAMSNQPVTEEELAQIAREEEGVQKEHEAHVAARNKVRERMYGRLFEREMANKENKASGDSDTSMTSVPEEEEDKEEKKGIKRKEPEPSESESEDKKEEKTSERPAKRVKTNRSEQETNLGARKTTKGKKVHKVGQRTKPARRRARK